MIKLKNGFSLYDIKGTHYLLPYGQNIAEHRHSMRFNDATRLFYEPLLRGTSKEELLELLAKHYEAEEKDIPTLKADISSFLTQMDNFHMLEHTLPHHPADASHFFKIGPAVIGYQGPAELLHPSFFDFSANQDISGGNIAPDMMITIAMYAPDSRAIGDILIRTDEIIISKSQNSYLFFYPADYGISEAEVSSDGSTAVFYCNAPVSADLQEKLFHAMRFAYLILAQHMDSFAIHSASVLYRNKAWLFSGSSGTGKSTHTALWQKLYATPYLNGDLNLLRIEQGVPIVYGLPWCGTSGLYTTKTYPLGGITFLKQAPADALVPLSEQDAVLRLMQRLISPSWTAELLAQNISFAEKLSDKTNLFYLQCTKEDSAAEVMKAAIDAALE